jgi:(R,R)-butanediol dehydrogenase / meso-butanediol dehydrogenase / diacetyl reductase
MKAGIYYGKEDIRIEDVPEPKCGPEGVKIQVKFCGICGGDLRAYLFGPDAHHPAGIILGHEFVGDVVDVGDCVKNIKVGDRVIPGIRAYQKLDSLMSMGLGKDRKELAKEFHLQQGGAFAKYVVKNKDILVKLDPMLDYEAAAVIEPTEVAIHGVRQANLGLGESVFVAGAGPIGLATLQAARAAGASKVFISENSKLRKQKAKALGVDEVLDFMDCKVPDEVHRLSGGKGVDVAFQCSPPALRDCVGAVRERGKVIVMAAHTEPVALDWRKEMLYRWVSLIPSMGVTIEDITCAMEFVANGRIKVGELVTDKIRLGDLVKGIESLAKGDQVKVLVSPE